MSESLRELIERAKKVKMTPADEARQRESFAYGSALIENSRITRDVVRQAAQDIAEGKVQVVEMQRSIASRRG
ncbi:MAG: hypothetical protein ACK4MV_17200 [Beijerinckiaceae bacterium]